MLAHHAPPVCAAAGFMAAGWAFLTLPIAGVVIIDHAFVVGDYLRFLIVALATALVVSAGLFFPLALLVERLSRGRRAVAVMVPLSLVLASFAVILVRLAITQDFIGSFFGWPGLVLALAVAFNVYWMVLWGVRSVLAGWKAFGGTGL